MTTERGLWIALAVAMGLWLGVGALVIEAVWR